MEREASSGPPSPTGALKSAPAMRGLTDASVRSSAHVATHLDPPVQALLLRILAEHRREVEGWMEQEHSRLQAAVIRACMPGEVVETTRLKRPEEPPSEATKSQAPSEHGTSQVWRAPFTPQSTTEKVDKSMKHLTHQNSEGLIPGSLRSQLHMLLKGRLGLFIGVLILLSATVTFVELQIYGDGRTETRHVAFGIFTHMFTMAFVIELLARLYVYQWHFFKSCFNLLDGSIVVLTCLDSWVLSYLDTNIVNIAFLRMVRFVRVARALRVMRTLNLFANLRVLVNAMLMSMPSLFWSMLVLFVFMLSCSLFLCQMLQDFIESEYDDPYKESTREWVLQHYGTSSKAMYTVFELTLSGCWPNYARRLIEDVHAGYAAFFILYVTAVVFAMIRIISALFLKDTLTCTANDDELICCEKIKEMNAVKAKLLALFHEADQSGNGFLDRKEFEELVGHPNVKVWLNALGLDMHSPLDLYSLLDKGNGIVSQHDFLDGISRLRGTARSQDVVVLMRNTNCILEQHALLCQALHTTLGVPLPQTQRMVIGESHGPHRVPLPRNAACREADTVSV